MAGKVVIISAPSGAGKTTVVRHLMGISELKLDFSVSACTRQMRDGEVKVRG
jgi:guanylate kinase